MPLLLLSFDENTIPWVILTGFIGTLLGAGIKFLFDEVLGPRLQAGRSARAAQRKYRYPLLQAADSLDRRIENWTRFVDKKWFDTDDYYRSSTLYLFGRFFGWCKILEDQAFLGYVGSDKQARDFSIRFYRAFKGMTGFYYFQELIRRKEVSSAEVGTATVPRLALTAIGELMIRNPEGKDGMPTVIGFSEFDTKYASPEFKIWFKHLQDVLFGVEASGKNLRWNRLLVFGSNLRAFVSFLDPAQRQTKARQIHYLRRLHPKVEARLRKELVESRQSHLIAE